MSDDLKKAFNGLSGADKLTLKSNAFIKVMSTKMRTDTEKNPWTYPFYVAYMVTVATPLPFLGAGSVVLAGSAAWIYMGITPGARKLKGTLEQAFNTESLVHDYQNFIVPHPPPQDRYKVDKTEITKATAKTVWADTKTASKKAYDYFFGPPAK